MKQLFSLLFLLIGTLGLLSSCGGKSERDLIGFWNLRAIDLSLDGGQTWKQYPPGGPDFLNLLPDGTGSYGDPTGVGSGADDVVWSLKGDSLFYYSPKWRPMDGETRALIIKCDNDSLVLGVKGHSRYHYSKRKRPTICKTSGTSILPDMCIHTP